MADSPEMQAWLAMSSDEQSQWPYLHPRNQKTRTAICKKIADAIGDVLLAESFVRCSTTFLRRWGDQLLQIISISCLDTWGQPRITVNVLPMFGWKGIPNEWQGYFCSIRSNFGIEGETVETLLGIKLDPVYNSYLAYREEFDEAIAKENELLRIGMIPLLNDISSVDDYIGYWQRLNPHVDCSRGTMSLKLYTGDYDVARELALENAQAEEKWIQEFTRKYGFTFETFREQYPSRYMFLQHYLSVVEMIDRHDRAGLIALLNQRLAECYEELGKYSKTFVKKYPLRPIV